MKQKTGNQEAKGWLLIIYLKKKKRENRKDPGKESSDRLVGEIDYSREIITILALMIIVFETFVWKNKHADVKSCRHAWHLPNSLSVKNIMAILRVKIALKPKPLHNEVSIPFFYYYLLFLVVEVSTSFSFG